MKKLTTGYSHQVKILFYTLITLSTVGVTIQLIGNLFTNLIFYSLFSLTTATILILAYIINQGNNLLISIENRTLIVHNSKKSSKETFEVSCDDIKFFETRFNEIIFHHKNDEKYIIQLDNVKSDTKRWEIKEMLRKHVPEKKLHTHFILKESA